MIQPGYFICYAPGTSGAFIASLVGQIVNSTTKKFVYSDHGNSHVNLADSNGGLDWALAPTPTTSEYFFKNLFTYNSGKPLVISNHLHPAWETIAKRWPTFKMILITHTIDDLDEIAASLFYKYYVDDFGSVSKKAFDDVIQTHSRVFGREIAHPDEMSESEKRLFMKIIVFHKITDGYIHPTVPPEFTANTLLLPYREIISNKDLVLDKLSTFLEKPIPEVTIDNYNSYMMYQRKLEREKMTWLKPFDL